MGICMNVGVCVSTCMGITGVRENGGMYDCRCVCLYMYG